MLPLSSKISFNPNTFAVNSTLQFSLSVSKYKGGNEVFGTIVYQLVKIKAEEAIVPQMMMSKKRIKINPNQDLLLQAVTLYPPKSNVKLAYLWKNLGDPISQDAFIQVNRNLPAINSEYLRIRAKTLNPLGNYTLSCEIKSSDNKINEVTTFTLAMNQPPSGGIIYVLPSNGTEGQTKFTITGDGWEDSDQDYPLNYAVYFQVSPKSGITRLSSLSASPSFTSILPAGNKANSSYELTIILQVIDASGADTNVTTKVVVSPLPKNERESNLKDLLNTTDLKDPISVMNTMGQTLSYINDTSGDSSNDTKKALVESLISSII